MTMNEAMLLIALTGLGFAAGVTILAIVFIRRQRLVLVEALQERDAQYRTALQQLGEALEQAQRQQRHNEQQLQDITQVAACISHDLVVLGKRVERDQSRADYIDGERVLH